MQTIREELASEVTEAREHWVAENTFNALLQNELNRMTNILAMVSWEGGRGWRVVYDGGGRRRTILEE